MDITTNFTSINSMKPPASEPVVSTIITPASRVKQSALALNLNQTMQDSFLNHNAPALDFTQTTQASYLNRTTQDSYLNHTTPALELNQTTPALYLNQTTQHSFLNHHAPALDFNQTTLASYPNQTTQYSYLNHTTQDLDLNQTTPALYLNQTTQYSNLNNTTPALDLNQTTPALCLNQTTQYSYLNHTTPALDLNQTTLASYLNQIMQHSYLNHTTPALDFSQTTTALYFNQTMQDSFLNHSAPALDFNQTNLAMYLDQNTSTNDLASGSIPLTGLTYTLFSLTCCFTFLGLCGNALILISMLKFPCRSKAHGVLIRSLAIFDMVSCLSWALIQPCVHDIFGIDIRAITSIGCKISWAILLPASLSSATIVVLICLERYLAVWFPLRSRKLLSKQKVFNIVCICVTPVVIIHATLPVLYAEVKNGFCTPNFAGSERSTVLERMPNTSVFNAAIGFTLVTSMLILSIFTPLTIVKLYRQWLIRRQLTASRLNATHFVTSVKLLAVVIAHIALIGSPGLVAIIFGLYGIIISEITIAVIDLAILANHSINFLLYNIFDAEFRRNVLALFGCNISKEEPRNAVEALNAVPTVDVPKNSI